MSNLFMPKEQMDLDDLVKPKPGYDFGAVDEVVLWMTSNSVFVSENFHSEAKLISDSSIKSVCVHDGSIFFGYREGNVFDYIDQSVFAYLSGPVGSLCSHNGGLYAGCSRGEVVDVGSKDVVCDGGMWAIDALCSLDGILYDCSGSYVRESVSNRVVAEREGINCLFNHKGVMYDGGGEGIWSTLDNNKVSSWKVNIYDMFYLGSDLHVVDADGCVYEFESKDQVGKLTDLYGACSVPRKIWEEVL